MPKYSERSGWAFFAVSSCLMILFSAVGYALIGIFDPYDVLEGAHKVAKGLDAIDRTVSGADKAADAIVTEFFENRPGLLFYTPILLMVATLVATAFLMIKNEVDKSIFGISIVIHTAVFLAAFAVCYFLYSFMIGAHGQSIWTSLYFAIVTWTTLGYGDIAPPPGLQLLAALEAILGYVYLGCIVTWLAVTLLPSDAKVRDLEAQILKLQNDVATKAVELTEQGKELENYRSAGQKPAVGDPSEPASVLAEAPISDSKS